MQVQVRSIVAPRACLCWEGGSEWNEEPQVVKGGTGTAPGQCGTDKGKNSWVELVGDGGRGEESIRSVVAKAESLQEQGTDGAVAGRWADFLLAAQPLALGSASLRLQVAGLSGLKRLSGWAAVGCGRRR